MRWVDELDEDAEHAVGELLTAARAADGRPEETDPARGGRHLLVHDSGVLAGYAHLDTSGDAFGHQVSELIVHPDHRRRGIGTRLARALIEQVPAKLRVWAHGDHPAAARIAERLGFSRARELLIMHTPVRDDWPEPAPPPGISLRTFVPGQDERAVIEVNARAFDWHPEQGSLTVDELRATETENWFDPAGFFLAVREDRRVAGFHWTKVHQPNPRRFGGEPVGEVYVVGVDPAAQGGGLGKVLTTAGLRYLREKGLKQVILYVEGDNAPAVAVYRRLGFAQLESDVQYAFR
ncbi:MAG TPA: mycothiol synthase [Amycolatopsis sp.]|uniref:mycothiol synthase n=1 Tax=Amycolatopsis sp. TaxID=37632 RepID=UPI002B45D3E4|nr:mycothiol synthase [Amycolatopsis sp.]HKS46255.1 mycothiol synthase [Amycolatopsis sp.]